MASLCTILSISFTILHSFRASHTVLTLVTCFTEPCRLYSGWKNGNLFFQLISFPLTKLMRKERWEFY